MRGRLGSQLDAICEWVQMGKKLPLLAGMDVNWREWAGMDENRLTGVHCCGLLTT